MNAWALITIAACCAAEDPPFLNNGVTAHRGNAADYPENTMAAFRSALEAGADWIELDVYASKDGHLVVIHDATTEGVGDVNVAVAEVTLDELRRVDVAHAFRSSRQLTLDECPKTAVPLLSDVLALIVSQNRTRLSIQPKAACVDEAIELIRTMKTERWVGFNDGDLDKMKRVKALAPEIPVFWDRPADSDLDDDLRIARECGFESLVVNKDGLTPAKVDAIHAAGFEAGVWTVNDEPGMHRFLDMGVDRFYTDYPARLLNLVRTRP